MLVRFTHSIPITNLLLYSFRMDKHVVTSHFQNNFKLARDQVTKISTQFNMNKQQSKKAFYFHPEVFKPQSKQFGRFKERVEWVKNISPEQNVKNLKEVLLKVMFDSTHMTYEFSRQDFDSLVTTVNKYFQNQTQIEKILTTCPNLINKRFRQIIEEKVNVLKNYLNITNEEAMKAFESSPFLLPSSTLKFKTSTISLLQDFGFSVEQIISQMKENGQIFLLGGNVLKENRKIVKNWGLKDEDIKQAYLNNPLLYFNYPHDVMPHKRKIFRFLKFTPQLAQQMIKKYPQVLIWSIRSLEQKALFIGNRLKMRINLQNLQLLTFNFNETLRPRGQILVRSKTDYRTQSIVEFMKLTDQQFMQRINAPIEKLIQEKSKFPSTLEMDFRRSKVLDKIGLREKFIKLAQAYSH